MASTTTPTTASPEEIARFQAMADAWWDAEGDFKPLHQLNPPRLAFLRDHLAEHFSRDATAPRPFEGLSLLDVGCGGGLLSEPMARLGFAVTAIDAGEKNIGVARLHAEQGGLDIDYRCATPETLDRQFDVVMTMEVIEHVPDADAFLSAVGDRLKPGGAFFGATLNRTPQSFALAIVGAEYILRWLPRGTHDWRKFVRPSEFAAALRRVGIAPKSFEGVRYAPLRERWERCASLEVNYAVYGVRAG
ncbi:bifunctional 2-polyprenyl-6-hydroxyphenol methylase/3-demethylubiquinol 3-O-methyltransferase UbiG [Telmatospirillum siberiense]|uniref:Ubiquinone biosynthesis O-methyltransferase n=1 Tax=Telmatospirillum siberiense TaxID=382514 RepID=A0A2N3Q0X8_9PROT|nr:bifunctional 2-polyprenyl-6-hydroxyphenol methylase/3-demethylubiquinol 3-O-methyltransferase UbiG [Telmatospirillum siberiense]PKU26320.1 bifunctional 3-demethylubiquinol 3-O-methyltransferase/2-polyprenyl-6-hydroxyphenol methylase [Telmatospirillum siberiense]